MNSYRLLRSNKESGPFSAEEMISMGFKAYDLIWVDGKSAGWRYPSELPEFKAYAPITEEQPFDRFFKKSDDNNGKVAAPEASVAEEVQAVATAPAMPTATPERVAPEAAKAPAYTVIPSQGGRHIYVTMPGGSRPATAAETPVRKETPVAAAKKATEPPPAIPVQKQETPPPPAAAPASLATSQDRPFTMAGTGRFSDSLETGSSQDDLLAYLPRKKNKAANLPWRLIAALFAGVAILVGLGIIIGLSMTSPKKEIAQEKAAVQPAPQQADVAPAEEHKPAEVVNPPLNTSPNVSSLATRVKQEKNIPAAALVTKQPALTGKPALTKQAPFRSQPVHGRHEEKPAGSTVPAIAKKQADPLPAETSREIPENVAAPVQKNAASNVAVSLKQVGFKINGYKVGAFGGVSDIQCMLINDSRSPLQQVEVELDYILANEKVFKTETLSFTDIAAGTHVVLTAPRSSRGIKVVSRIKKVTIRENNFTNITVKS